MTKEQLARLLENLTAQLQPSQPGQEKLLKKAQEIIAATVLKDADADVGEQIAFENITMFSNLTTNPTVLKQIQLVAENTLKDVKLISEQEEPETDTRFYIRTTPILQHEVAGSMPDWAIGGKPAEMLGPFLNLEGREIWIDIYKVEKLVTLYMSGKPVLLFKTAIRRAPISILDRKLGRTGQAQLATEYTLLPGSIWMNAQLLSPAAPSNKFVGLKVKKGTIKISVLPTLQNNQITISPAAAIAIDVTIDQQQSALPAGAADFGIDAKAGSCQLPESLSLRCKSGKVDIIGMGAAACTIYGRAISFTNTNQAAITLEYNTLLSKLLIPFNFAPNSFEVKSCESPLFDLSGKAMITKAYWGLPVATLNIDAPVQAETGGAFVLYCGAGLSARWKGVLYQPIRLIEPVIIADAANISILDYKATGLGARQTFDLWKEADQAASTVEVAYLAAAPFLLTISATLQYEMLTIYCDATIKADRPLKVDSRPFDVNSKGSALMLAGNADKTLLYLYDDNLLVDNKKPEDKDPTFEWQAIGLENAVFTVSPVTGFMLFSELHTNGIKIKRANLFFQFALANYLPILPDPYVGNLMRWKRLFGGYRGETAPRVAMMSSMANIKTMLTCAIRYAAGVVGDTVTTNFFFGTPPPQGWTLLPESDEQPVQPNNAGTPEQPNQPLNERGSGRLQPIKQTGGRTILTGLKANLNIHTSRTFRPIVVNTAINTVALQTGARLAQLKNSIKIKVSDLIKEPVILQPIGDLFKPKFPNKPPIPQSTAVLETNTEGEALDQARKIALKGSEYEAFWDNHIIGDRLHADAFTLLDVSSNANQMGISLNGNMLIVKTGKVTNNAEGDARVVAVNSAFPFIVEGMSVKSPANLVKTFTLPQIAWEPVLNLTPPDRDNPDDPNSPILAMDPEAGPLYFANDGGATKLWNNSTKLVTLAPIPAIAALIGDFKENPANYTVAAFTLPFGLKAISYISKNFVEPVKPSIENLQPVWRPNYDGSYKLQGGIQLQLNAGDFGKPVPTVAEKDAPMFPGYIIQLNNLLDGLGLPSGASNLGHRVTEIFNNEFLMAPMATPGLEHSRGVPLSRMDITGYGANIFSKWLSPTAAMAQTSQSRFDVMLGRTAQEVIQVKSILYPWGIRVVRTITVFRTSTGYVYRTDSGWKAESDGLFDFSYRYLKLNVNPYTPPPKPTDFVTVNEPFEFHPGTIHGLFNIRNIKDAPSVAAYNSENHIAPNSVYVNGVKGMEMKAGSAGVEELVQCGAVYFDADVAIENVVQGHVNKRVVSKKILGYVQVAPAGKPLTPVQLRELMSLHGGSIGGDIDCIIDINQSNQQMKLTRFDANTSVDAAGNPVFVLAARGQVILPKDGSWTMVQHDVGTGNVTPLASAISVPLIRKGKWTKGKVVQDADVANELLRIAHPLEIIREAATNTINFGYLQSTSTQKALFLTPAYGRAKKMLLSKTPPIFADAYRLMTGNGIFPNIGNAIDNFGKAVPLFFGKNPDKTLFEAFTTNPLKDGLTNVLELMQIKTIKDVVNPDTIIEQGMGLLQKGANNLLDKAMQFDVPSFEVPLVDTEALRIYIEYKTGKKNEAAGKYVDSRLQFDVESFADDLGKQWKSRLNNLAMVVDLGDMKRLMTIKGNFDAKKGKATNFEGGSGGVADGLPVPEIEFSDALQPVIDILEILATLSAGNYAETMKKGLKIAMSNSGEIWEYKFEANKEIPLVRFPPSDELYNSAQTPLKLEASLGLGVYFNAALKVTSDPGQLLPTAGAFLSFHGGMKVMCVSVGAGSLFAVGNVAVKIACDTKVGPSLALDFGFGVEIVISLPVVGNASVSYMMGIQMYADKDKVIVAALMRFRGQASLLGGLVSVTITIEAKGIIVKDATGTDCSAQVTFALDISIFLVIDISFSKTWGEDRQIA